MNATIRILATTAAFLAASLSAAQATDEDDSRGVKAITTLTIVAASSLEAKATLTEEITFPLLAGPGALVSGNNVKLKLGAELSPVSVNAVFETVWTPIAFLEFNAGASIGSGWNFLGIANGVGINSDGGSGNEIATDPFPGAAWKAKAGGAFQFDLAALSPGDWNHVLLRTYHEVNYRALTSAGAGDSWQYEADYGENRNGFNYYANYFLGYKMPIFLETAGFLLETDLYLYETANRASWGDDLVRFNFGPLLNFRISETMTIALLAQVKTMRNFTTGTENYFYQNRVLDTANPTRLVFNRVAVSFSMQL